jgi:hypothetical protein
MWEVCGWAPTRAARDGSSLADVPASASASASRSAVHPSCVVPAVPITTSGGDTGREGDDLSLARLNVVRSIWSTPLLDLNFLALTLNGYASCLTGRLLKC